MNKQIQLLSMIVVTTLVATSVWGDGPADNRSDSVRPVPPLGIELSAGDERILVQGLMELSATIDSIRDGKNAHRYRYLPDVEVFQRAVEQAVRYREMFQPGDVKKAEELLMEGKRRGEELQKLMAPAPPSWATQRGLVVRGFRSRLDDTVQPYGVVIEGAGTIDAAGPIDPTTRHRCDLWFHGRGETVCELQFIHSRMHQKGQYSSPDTIVLHPFARYSNANKLAGEVDSLEALEHAQSEYNIDPDRISIRGFSMGGAACWHLAVHYPDRWFAANPGAGFSETPEFLKSFQGETLTPFWWEEKLWRLYDSPYWVENLRHCPTIAYSGEIDRQKQAADVMDEAFRSIGIPMTHIIGPQTAHKIHPDSANEIQQKMAALAERGRERNPKEIRFVTYSLKYNRMHWVTVNGITEHWERSSVAAQVINPQEVVLKTRNVTDLTLEFAAGTALVGFGKVTITLDDQQGDEMVGDLEQLIVPGKESDGSWRVRLTRQGGGWDVTDADELQGPVAAAIESTLKKRHNLQGPIDDALMDSFLFVKPSKPAANEAVEKWVQAEMSRAVSEWRKQMRGDVRIKFDHEVTDEDIANHHLILWGSPEGNAYLQRILDRLPIQWSATELQVDGQEFAASHHVPILIYPNPLNGERYVVLNSGLTYREYDYLNNARQVPKLPDWAIIDLTTPPGPRFPGKIVDADFFDEQWLWKRSPERKGAEVKAVGKP